MKTSKIAEGLKQGAIAESELIKQAQHKLIFALDVPDWETAQPLLIQLRGPIKIVKVGLELFIAEGPAVVRKIIDNGFEVMLDLKLNDIPATMQRAAAQAKELGVTFLTVHASSGPQSIHGAVQGVDSDSSKILAVTILTSIRQKDLPSIGMHEFLAATVKTLAETAMAAGAGGIVCSPEEVSALRRASKRYSETITLVTPGIRPEGSQDNDQARISTPFNAIKNGADYLVVGRPIRDATCPHDSACQIVAEIGRALAAK
ncbi:MAG: orotidine-5'-phosphate decarboxylase [Planctomycetota bacterium]|jgi:orotidine-5'-phosphate decarboxylase